MYTRFRGVYSPRNYKVFVYRYSITCESIHKTAKSNAIVAQKFTSFSSSFYLSERMKEAIVAKGPKVSIHDVPIPKPKPNQILIKVVVSGSNPKDWKRPNLGEPHNSGDDIAGIVEAIGDNVIEFKKGDRVAAFHEMMTPNGSFAEYAMAWDYTTFHLPDMTSFEEVDSHSDP